MTENLTISYTKLSTELPETFIGLGYESGKVNERSIVKVVLLIEVSMTVWGGI